MTARPFQIGVVAIVAFAVGLFVARALVRPVPEPQPPTHATLFPEPRPLPAIELIDQDGHALDAGFFAGHWTLVFFGFTQCPDVCPTTLATLARTRLALEDLPPFERPRVLLVSVDPEHDTPAILASYVRFFDPSFLAATGETAAISTFAGGFGVPYAKVALDGDAYTVDHGSGVFVVGPGGIVAYSSAPHDASVLAHDYRLIVARDGTTR